MKNILLLSVFLLINFSIYAQNEKIYDFFGGKAFGNSTVFYRLVFQINSDNIVSGYSFTDERGPKETKAIIQGTYNPKTKLIHFKETKKLLTRNNNILKNCYLNAKISLTIAKNNNKIKGSFFENTKSGNTCLYGTIALISPDDLSELKSEEITKIDSLKISEKKILIPNFKTKKKTILKTDEKISIFWNSDTLILEVWDEKKEDDDQITIQLNNDVILKKYSLKNKKEILKIPLKEKENNITITANNTGYIGNNTARIDLIDNEITHEIISQLDVKKSVTIHIIKN